MSNWRRALAQLFPPYVRSVLASSVEDHPSPFEEEVRAVARAVPRRQREFLSGRHCAHEALRALGLDDGPVLVGSRREPLWPPGAVGSIAHAGGWSVAVAARATDVRGVGVDVEVLEPPLADDVDRLVRTAAERAQMFPRGHVLTPHAAKVAFSIKETVYKCLFPRTRWPLEFADLHVSLDLDRHAYTARVDERFEPDAHGLEPVEGRFRVVDGYVVAGLWLPPVS